VEISKRTIWQKLGLFICNILNFLPVLHLSRDEDFDSISQINDLRFSLIAIPLGDSYWYFATYSPSTKFSLFELLEIHEIQPKKTKSELSELVNSLDQLPDDNGNNELRLEFLKHKHDQCQASINILNNKVNNYIAIALVYTGFIAFLFQSCLKFSAHPLSWLLWSLLLLSTLSLSSLLILLRKYLKVKGAHKSKFGEFKTKPSWLLFVKGVYLDWQSAQDEQLASATLVKNIEKQFFRSVSVSFLLLLLVTYLPFSSDFDLIQNDGKENLNEFTIFDKQGKFSAIELLHLSKKINSNSDVLFILSKSNQVGKNSIKFIIKALELSNRYSVVEVNNDLFDKNILLVKIKENDETIHHELQ
jgi:hypothetical protein